MGSIEHISIKAQPREWQRRALLRWTEKLRGVARVVTGGGKTLFAQLCIEQFQRREPRGCVSIIVPTVALLDQWLVSLVEDGGVPVGHIACYSGEEKPVRPGQYNIMVLNTARDFAPKLSSQGQDPWMLVVDECHRAGSEKNALALRGTYRATLGLSATPEREYDDGFIRWVEPALGPVICDYGYVEAAKDGIISPFALHNIRVAFLPDEQSEFDKLTRRISAERAMVARGGGSEERLARLLQKRGLVLSSATMRIPVAVKLAERHFGQRTIIFHERVEAANTLHTIIVERGGSATLYHTGIAPAVRRDNLRLFRKGVFDILICCRALDEGINIPETVAAIIASSTASVRQRIQRLGRVLRPAKGKEFADIYTIYASDMEAQRLVDEAMSLSEVAKVSWMQVG